MTTRRSRGGILSLMLACVTVGCGGCGEAPQSADGPQALKSGYGPDGSFHAPPADGNGKSLAARWPILLSHHYSGTGGESFQGDASDLYGVKAMLEAGGAVVFQPDKLAYGSHEVRGQLLYKKCAGATLDELLCKNASPQVVDGVHLAMQTYCADPALRARNDFDDETACQKGLQFNVICHSQGCADSRYMLAAVRNEYSGELMYRHVASWTSMAGANKGTAQADWYLEIFATACALPGCAAPLIDAAFAVDSLRQNQAVIVNGNEAAKALSLHYMLLSTDMQCDPAQRSDCPPSFNQRFPLPDDPEHPVFYQSFTSQIDDISHPCYQGNQMNWDIVAEREGPNDGNISLNSQRFTTYGWAGSGGRTPVLDRWVSGESLDPAVPHPGLNHMSYSMSKVPGMDEGRMSCNGEDNSMFRFSRTDLYRDIVAELTAWGY
jgi:hypothetical protein